ncbi:MAG TPA: hypothetical protein VLH75_13675 [Longimicrobiales bacterium]|nr:hypothetical protein [Longimicrobiales bacterium]
MEDLERSDNQRLIALDYDAAARIQATGSEARFQRSLSRLGQLTLASYAEQYGYDLAEMQAILAAAGYALDPDARLRDEASRLGTDPEGILEVLNGTGGGAEG